MSNSENNTNRSNIAKTIDTITNAKNKADDLNGVGYYDNKGVFVRFNEHPLRIHGKRF